MAAEVGTKSVIAALLANTGIAVAKFAESRLQAVSPLTHMISIGPDLHRSD